MTSGSCSISGHSTDFFDAVDVDALAILARGVEEAADDARAEVGVLEFDVRASRPRKGEP